MSLLYIIDAYNIINHPSFKPAGKQNFNVQKSLLEFIRSRRLTGSAKNKIILVFDGYPPAGEDFCRQEGVLFVFSRKISADELIEKLISESAHPGNIVVVSDDRQVQITARSLRANTCGVAKFNADKPERVKPNDDSEETKVSYVKMQKINEELKQKWLS